MSYNDFETKWVDTVNHKRLKVKHGDTIVLESPEHYFCIEVDKHGCFLYYTKTKGKRLK